MRAACSPRHVEIDDSIMGMRPGHALLLLLGLSLGSCRAYVLVAAPSASRLCASRVAAVMTAEDDARAAAMAAGESSGEVSAAASVLASDAAMNAAIDDAALTAALDDAAMTAAIDDAASVAGGMSESAAEPPAAPAPPPVNYLEESDLINTRWALTFTPRKDAWRGGNEEEQEFALLKDGSVRWAGGAGGTGTGGRWQLRDQTLEVIRTTPLGLITGRDYYMAIAQAQVRLPSLPPDTAAQSASGGCARLPRHSASHRIGR